ncbi:MAG: hypothetical protein K0S23_2682 [Fluviicola sp.]|jgi:hypothetical protein|uniref:hypothetical protein n=1 Tax=Fluviicola sp. TaxID=1917219 RepID=UPI002625BA16|nr:hypothetical protein [Fluviicola sp.]MDF3028375.1 hypothetical protein [Fluviicola sp.]
MSLKLHKTFPDRNNFHLFSEVKKQVYIENSAGQDQSDDLNLEFLVECIVVTENDIPVGRLALYHNPELFWKDEKACCIGNFECVNKTEVALFMQHEVDHWAKENGFRYILGPMNGSTWDNYRFSVHHNNPFFLSEAIHPLYYNDLFRKVGFEVILNYQSRIERGITVNNEKVAHKIRETHLNGITLREFDASRIYEELEKLFPLVKAAFERNTLYTSISWETFYRKYAGIIRQLGTRYVLLAEKEGELIAFVFAFQNFLEKTKKQLVYKTVARKYGNEYAGVGHVIALEVMKRAVEDGMEDAIHAFMIYDATSAGISQNFNSQPYRKYVLYAKSI